MWASPLALSHLASELLKFPGLSVRISDLVQLLKSIPTQQRIKEGEKKTELSATTLQT